jgi:hypothetical protein
MRFIFGAFVLFRVEHFEGGYYARINHKVWIHFMHLRIFSIVLFQVFAIVFHPLANQNAMPWVIQTSAPKHPVAPVACKPP